MTGLEIVVDGDWQSLDGIPGNVQYDTIWPGGLDQLSWTPGLPPTRRLHAGLDVRAVYGDYMGAGDLTEPDASQPQLSATGAWRAAANFPALDGSSDATTVPDDAIDQAIALGLNWTRPTSISGSAVALDISTGPVMLDVLLNAWSEESGLRWAVNELRQVYKQADPTTPVLQVWQKNGLGFSLDTYASGLVGVFLNSATSDFDKVTVEGGAPFGPVYATVDLTPRGAITSTKATTIITNLLALGRGVPNWTAPIQVSYGEILTMGDTKVALETVKAGQMVRVQGGYDLAARLNNQMYLDVLIGQTSLSGGLLTIQPLGFSGRATLEDALMAVVNHTKTLRGAYK